MSVTVTHDLEAASARNPDGAAVIADSREITWRGLQELADGLAAGLHALGVGRGDRVVTVIGNSIEAVVAIQGALRAGAVLVPLNPGTKHERLRFVIAETEASALLCDSEHTDVCRAAAAAAGVGRERVITDVASAARVGTDPPPAPLGTDLAAILYTSGSTGAPKGVMLTHANLAFVTGSIVEYLRLTDADRILCVLQLSFGYGLAQLLTCTRVGATLVLEGRMAFPGTVVQALEHHRITGFAGVPTIFQILVALHGLADRKLPELRFLTNAGASMPAATVAAVRGTFPRADLFLMYGLTECIRVSYLPPEELEGRPTSSGIPIPGTDAWIAGPDGGPADVGVVGELMVRGPHVMQGYWRDPELTAERLHAGRWPWEPVLATGDLFLRDAEGFLHWQGRTDDLIKCRGEKVYPREVEEALHSLTGVAEAAVVGVPDELLGHAVHAHVVVASDSSLDEPALRRHCAELLEDHKVPKRVFLHESLPRTGRDKVDRHALIERSLTPLASG